MILCIFALAFIISYFDVLYSYRTEFGSLVCAQHSNVCKLLLWQPHVHPFKVRIQSCSAPLFDSYYYFSFHGHCELSSHCDKDSNLVITD